MYHVLNSAKLTTKLLLASSKLVAVSSSDYQPLLPHGSKLFNDVYKVVLLLDHILIASA
jgi:hypothetical protein